MTIYDYGISTGMIYPENGRGLPWPGLVKVTVDPGSGSLEPIYYDARKYDIVSIPTSATINVVSFSLPTYVGELVGRVLDSSGIVYDGQPSKMFSLAYRTETEDNGHKLVVHFNTMATLNDYELMTTNEQVDPTEYTLSGESVPQTFREGILSSRIELSSRSTDPELMKAFEYALLNSDMSSIIQVLSEHNTPEDRANALRNL